MYFTRIQLVGRNVIELPIIGARPADVYILKSADGLGPPPIDVAISAGKHLASTLEEREIVISIGLNPDYGTGLTAGELRERLYGLLYSGTHDPIRVNILRGNELLISIDAHITKLEASIFSDSPEVQLTARCISELWDGPAVIHLAPTDHEAPSLHNQGTAFTGFRMEVIFTADLQEWVLSRGEAEFRDEFRLTHDFHIADKVVLDTRFRKRGVWLLRGGIETSLLGALSAESAWHQLYPGENVFETSSAAFEWGDLYYKPQYWGV
jgi:hypothetical protein